MAIQQRAQKILLTAIDPCDFNPPARAGTQAMQSLLADIDEREQLVPAAVKVKRSRFTLIDGRRRFQVLSVLNRPYMVCDIHDNGESDAVLWARLKVHRAMLAEDWLHLYVETNGDAAVLAQFPNVVKRNIALIIEVLGPGGPATFRDEYGCSPAAVTHGLNLHRMLCADPKISEDEVPDPADIVTYVITSGSQLVTVAALRANKRAELGIRVLRRIIKRIQTGVSLEYTDLA